MLRNIYPYWAGGGRYRNEQSNACAGSYRPAPKDATESTLSQVKQMVIDGLSARRTQKLPASLSPLVGEDVTKLAVSGTIRMVFAGLLGY